MLYVETATAVAIFSIGADTLKKSAQRKSTKYPFIRITNAGTRSRGGVKLLFEISVADMDNAIRHKKLDRSAIVYVRDGAELVQKRFSDIKPQNLTIQETTKNKKYFTLDDKQQDDVSEKIKVLKEWEEYKKAGLSSKKFCKDFNITEARLFRWQRSYREKGAVGLADQRGKNRKGKSKLEEWMKEFCLMKFRACGAGFFNWMQLREELHMEAHMLHGYDFAGFLQNKIEPLCDVGTIKRFVIRHYSKPENLLEYIYITKGEDKVKSYFQPAMGSQSEMVIKRNQCWQIDSSPLDVIVRDGKDGQAFRPDLLSIVDVYSGRCVASVEKISNQFSLIRLFRKALERFGKPDYIKGDNGKDYLSKRFQKLLDGLDIYYDKAIAYAGDEKGFVERHFETLQHSGLSMVPGYIGFNNSVRESIEQRTAKKERKAKDKHGHIKKTNQKYLMTYEEIQMKVEAEVLKWDLNKNRRAKGELSRLEKWNADSQTPLKMVEYSEFLLYAGGRESRIVGKKGISYEAMQYECVFLPPVGTEVQVRENIDDINEIYVFTPEGEFICTAHDKSVSKMNVESYAMVKKAFKEQLKTLRKVISSAEFTNFTKQNAKYDLSMVIEAHKEALQPEKWIDGSSADFNKIRKMLTDQLKITQAHEIGYEVPQINSLKTEMTPITTDIKQDFSLDAAIEKHQASGY